MTEDIFERVLDHTFTPNDVGEEMTVRVYLASLLKKIFEEGENFSGKRPFGNSGWELNLVEPMIECELLAGRIDRSDPDWPEAVGYDMAAFEKKQGDLIRYAMGVK